MKVLLIAADSNIMNRFRRICSWSKNTYDIVCLKTDCHKEIEEGFDKIIYLDCDYYGIGNSLFYDNRIGFLFSDDVFQHEKSCLEINKSYKFIEYYIIYNYSQIKRGFEYLTSFDYRQYDCVVVWGERSWYNFVVMKEAKTNRVPVVCCERAAYPSMVVMDTSFGSKSHFRYFVEECGKYSQDDILRKCSMAAYWDVEPQPITTMGMILDEVKEIYKQKKDNIVFVPLQVPYDTNMTYPNMIINDNKKLLEYVIDKYGNNSFIIAKKHPADKFTSNHKLSCFCRNNNIFLVDFDASHLIELADVVVTINSQAAIKALALGKKVEILGETYFNVGNTEIDSRRIVAALFDYYVSYYDFDNRLHSIISNNQT